MNLKNKAILVENPAQDRKMRKVCREAGIGIATAKKYACPYYYMVVQSRNGSSEEMFLVPNSEFDSEGGVADRGYDVITSRQFEKAMAEERSGC